VLDIIYPPPVPVSVEQVTVVVEPRSNVEEETVKILEVFISLPIILLVPVPPKDKALLNVDASLTVLVVPDGGVNTIAVAELVTDAADTSKLP
jgi:hypothetical protein